MAEPDAHEEARNARREMNTTALTWPQGGGVTANAAKNWVFTLNNYTDEDLEHLREFV